MRRVMCLAPCKGWENFKDKQSLQRRDYRYCKWTGKGRLIAISKCVLAVLLLGFFFYRSLWGCLFLSPLAALLYKREERRQGGKQREELKSQFTECVLSVATMLRAGASAENAFLEAEADMRAVFGEQSDMVRELQSVRRGLQINITLEELLEDLGARSDCEELREFAAVFRIAKRSGGSLAEIIGQTAEQLNARAETKRELNSLLGGKRMELLIMEGMPFAMLFYIGVANPGYFDLLYESWIGRVIMTGCLGVYCGSFLMGDRILRKLEQRLE